MHGAFDVLNTLVLPDAWQAEAVRLLRTGNDVVVDAPTGAGKTFILERHVEESRPPGQVLYAAPTRALANDKYAEWLRKGWRTGLCTGDATLDLDAPVLCGTLEALAPRLHRAPAPAIFTVDEYQWLADPHRGNHYEGALLSAPAATRLLLLSGCVRNAPQVAAWLQRLGRPATVVHHAERPVPLEEVDADALDRRVPKDIAGFWSRRLTGALQQDLGPVLVFAPARREAERLARQAARELPLPEPLALTPEQRDLLGSALASLVEKRVAYHHSGLTWAQRAGVIEPLAKAGQLRVVVSTLGLASGINFSLRSVLITARRYHVEGIERSLQPHEILQMAGRAARRGLDTIGYLLATEDSVRLSEASPLQLRRSDAFPWPALLSQLGNSNNPRETALAFARSLFTNSPPSMGCEHTIDPAALPCRQPLDTSRARLVRRTKKPFQPCRTCAHRAQCLEFSPHPTLLWQWRRLGLLDKSLRPTPRGRLAGAFSGPEGLATAAALEEPDYPVEDIILDLADCFGGERFAGTEPRWAGRIALACQKAYGRFSAEGYLVWGVPVQYGYGAAALLRQVLDKNQRKARLADETIGRGDIDRLLIEWTSLLRQIANAPAAAHPRLPALQEQANTWLRLRPPDTLPALPPLTPKQTTPVSHRLRLS